MDLVTFCLIVAVWQLMIGIPALIHPARFEKWFQAAREQDLLMRVVGCLWVVVPVLVLFEDASVKFDDVVEGVVQLMAWVTFIKCVIFCWWPQQLIDMPRKIYGEAKWWVDLLLCTFGGLFVAAALHLREIA